MYCRVFLQIIIYYTTLEHPTKQLLDRLFQLPDDILHYPILFTIHHSPFTIHHSPFTIHHSPFTIHHSPFTIHHSPFPIPHSPFPIPHSPFPIPHSPFPIPHSPIPNPQRDLNLLDEFLIDSPMENGTTIYSVLQHKNFELQVYVPQNIRKIYFLHKISRTCF